MDAADPYDVPSLRATERLMLELLPDRPTADPSHPASPQAFFYGESFSPLPAMLANLGWSVDWMTTDLYRAEQIKAMLASGSQEGSASPHRLHVESRCDPPAKTYQLALLPTRTNAEAELTRDIMQSAVQQLLPNGYLITAVNHATDRWLGDQIHHYPGQIRALRDDEATAYRLRKKSDKFRIRNFRCEFAFKDQGRLIKVRSRPGVFSHRRIDRGARRLIEAMQIGAKDRVIDIGCGTGTVALAAALRSPTVRVHAIDSHQRAVECTIAGAEQNGLNERFTVELCADGRCRDRGSYDVALGNPPYYANQRIAFLFLDTAWQAVRPGGRVWMVGKRAEWFEREMPRRFQQVEIDQQKGYCIAFGIKRPGSLAAPGRDVPE